MSRSMPAPARAHAPGEAGTEPPRCPGCGSGDLVSIRLARPGGEVLRAGYCAGTYDRDRRRFLRRSCGYSGLPAAEPPTARDEVA